MAVLRCAQSPVPASPIFIESAAQARLAFTHVSGATGQYYIAEQMGAGVALFDYDGDGDLDVFLVQGRTVRTGREDRRDPSDEPVVSQRPERRGRRARTLQFTDVTAGGRRRLRAAYGMGAAVGDYDNDGDLDLFVTSFGPETLYRNNGDGTFTDVTQAGGRERPALERERRLRRLRPRRRSRSLRRQLPGLHASTANKRCNDALGARDYCSPRAYRPVPDRLYRNEGGGRFTDVTEAAGISKADGAGLGVSTGDYNGDGWLDLYVANDATPNQLWINQRNGTFVDEGLLSGSALERGRQSRRQHGHRLGRLRPRRRRGPLRHQHRRRDLCRSTSTTAAGASTMCAPGWDCRHRRRRSPASAPTGSTTTTTAGSISSSPTAPSTSSKRSAGRSCRSGCGTSCSATPAPGGSRTTSKAGGPAFDRAEIGRGAAFGDIDNDGDVDVVVTNNHGPVRLLLNQVGTRNHWLQVRLQQAPGNRFGFGAWVGVERAGRPTAWRRVRTDGSYLSASDGRVHVGLGDVVRDGRRGRAVARRGARTLVERRRRPARHAAARDRCQAVNRSEELGVRP